jgi:ectoine hydroxylase-related dioxygenase (phytanoyl-CoA dioxygenase family)
MTLECKMKVFDLQNRMADYIEAFSRDGFLVLPNFFDGTVIESLQADIDAVKHERPYDVVIDNLENGERTVLGLMQPDAVWRDRMKINDLYLTRPQTRDLALAPDLVPILWALLGHVPALCNSLYLEKGSDQGAHVDSLYMTPRTQGHLIATWVALEDAHEDAGPLEYFPGSHKIEQMRFSDGTYHEIANETQLWQEYMASRVAEAGLQKRIFKARKGDVFVWHAHLLHGGAPIKDNKLSRKSCVFHYYSESDLRASDQTLIPKSGAYWMDRAPQPLPQAVALQLPFSEAAYLKRYPDVAAAIQDGSVPSGRTHFEKYGQKEGRLPC